MDLYAHIQEQDIQDDLDQFIHFVLQNPFKLTPKGTIPPKQCWEIDGLMIFKTPYPNPKSSFKEYPLLLLFVEVLSKAKILKIEKLKGGLFFIFDQEHLLYYQSFNKVEKYFFLLNIFLNECDYVAIAGSNDRSERFTPVSMDAIIEYMFRFEKKEAENFRIYDTYLKFLYTYFYYLGFIELEYTKEYKFYCRTAEITPLGKQLSEILFKNRKCIFWSQKAQRFPKLIFSGIDSFMEIFEGEKDRYAYALVKEGKNNVLDVELMVETEIKKAQSEKFIDAFVPYFPANILTKSIENKINLEVISGNYIFKIALYKDIWRKIAISGKDSLEDLHLAIQEAFKFDNDHLYAFYLDGNPYSGYAYQDPRGEQGLDASAVNIENLYLEVGQKILYLFDFGDNWQFEIVLEGIKQDEPLLKKYKIIEKEGKAPKQYSGNW